MHIERGALEGFYPLHETIEKDALKRKWVVCCASPGAQPLTEIKVNGTQCSPIPMAHNAPLYQFQRHTMLPHTY
jgi:hypothetical protein